mmetsp:Transcript_28255/g.31390  ORF Transcript_28255/g.31390 Transcript_28255/m.31390 type:complete len:120 (+) Transcript_28255:1-360(+)
MGLTGGCCSDKKILLCILAVFLSPLAVLIDSDCGTPFFINLILFLLFVIPGIIHAWFVILSGKEFWNVIYTVLCIIGLSPVAVVLKKGCTKHFFINLILWILGIIPGIIHGLWVVWTHY